MKTLFSFIIMIGLISIGLVGCNGGGGGGNSSEEMQNTDLVESGTYTGTAERVDSEEKEIYVKTEDDQTLELYFTDQTTVTKNGQSATFDDLEKGQKIEVEVEKKGKRLEPISVRILE